MGIEWSLKIKEKHCFFKKTTVGWHKKDKKFDWNTSFNKKVYQKSLQENKSNTVI